MAETAASPESPALARALRRALRPVAHLCIALGVGYPAVARLLREIFFEVALEDFRLPGRPQTDSRLSLLTGIHRKEIRRLRTQPRETGTAPPSVSLGAQIAARWLADRRYTDEAGHPLPLPQRPRREGEPSFEELVAEVSRDIRPRAVLDEWLRLGVVRLDEAGLLHLDERAFVPRAGLEEKLFYFGRNVGDHAAAAAHNVLGGQPPLLERAVYYDQLSPESLQALAALSRRLGIEALQAVNRQALFLQERDAGRDDATERMSFGVYFYGSDAQTPTAPPLTAAGAGGKEDGA